MDLYTVAFICLVSSAVSLVITTILLWIEGRRDTRARERQAREAQARANSEVSRRPRVPAPSPLPTLNQGMK